MFGFKVGEARRQIPTRVAQAIVRVLRVRHGHDLTSPRDAGQPQCHLNSADFDSRDALIGTGDRDVKGADAGKDDFVEHLIKRNRDLSAGDRSALRRRG